MSEFFFLFSLSYFSMHKLTQKKEEEASVQSKSRKYVYQSAARFIVTGH